MNRRSLMTALVVGVVFLAGALAGAAVMRYAGSRGRPFRAAETDAGARPSSRDDGRTGDRNSRHSDRDRNPVFGLSRLLDQQLDLTDRQKGEVQEILARRSQEAREMFQESRHRFRNHLDSTVAELKGVLTPEQADRFQQLLDDLRARRGEPRAEQRQN